MENADRALSGSKLQKVLLATLVVPFSTLLVASRLTAEAPTSELAANVYSTSLALCCWWAAWRLVFARIFGRRLFLTLTLLVLLRMALNFGHFYFVFAPLAGIESSNALRDANFTGDLGRIFNSALIFLDRYRDYGVFDAVFGDYFRGINNPGVAILYGSLFSIFGTYATSAIPWAIIYSAFGALVVGLTGLSMALPSHHCRAATLLAFLMPGFFVFPPIYRDNFMIYLLVLSGYSALVLRREKILLMVAAVVVESVLLYSLRGVYLFLPLTFCLITLTIQLRSEIGMKVRGVALAILLIPVIVVSRVYLEERVDESLSRLSGPLQGDGAFPILSPFRELGPLAFFPAAAVFLLLSPMPWWQPGSPALLSYQVFSYGQTWYSLTAIVALVTLFGQRMISTDAAIQAAFFGTAFLLALLGSYNLGAGYAQVGLPFVILASIRYLKERGGRCFVLSTAIVVLAHALLWLSKL